MTNFVDLVGFNQYCNPVDFPARLLNEKLDRLQTFFELFWSMF